MHKVDYVTNLFEVRFRCGWIQSAVLIYLEKDIDIRISNKA